MVFQTTKSTFSFSKDIADTSQPFLEHDLPFYEANFHIYTNDVNYGDGSVMSAIAQANAVLYFENGNIRDFFFKNRTAGSTATVVVVATVPFEAVKKALKM